jgi:hypothetical protein
MDARVVRAMRAQRFSLRPMSWSGAPAERAPVHGRPHVGLADPGVSLIVHGHDARPLRVVSGAKPNPMPRSHDGLRDLRPVCSQRSTIDPILECRRPPLADISEKAMTPGACASRRTGGVSGVVLSRRTGRRMDAEAVPVRFETFRRISLQHHRRILRVSSSGKAWGWRPGVERPGTDVVRGTPRRPRPLPASFSSPTTVVPGRATSRVLWDAERSSLQLHPAAL